jgi:hypothetical protein
MIKNLFKILFITSIFYFLINKAYAATDSGLATEYQIKITKIELCEVGSSLEICLSPKIVSSGATIGTAVDIGAVDAGQSAGVLGNFGLATPGKTYTHVQVTMDRKIQITGTTDGGDDCRTAGDGSYTANAAGHASNAAASAALFVPAFTFDATFIQINGVEESDGSGLQDVPGVVSSGREHFESREALTEAFTLIPGQIPSVFIAFETTTAVTHGNSGTCGSSQMYATPPSVTITVK